MALKANGALIVFSDDIFLFHYYPFFPKMHQNDLGLVVVWSVQKHTDISSILRAKSIQVQEPNLKTPSVQSESSSGIVPPQERSIVSLFHHLNHSPTFSLSHCQITHFVSEFPILYPLSMYLFGN